MDIDLLKTFIEVARLRHFGKAAERVFITQSAVSARIKLLEETIGTPLLTRDRNNIKLTEAGHRLLKSATSIVNLWERTRSDLTLASEHRGPILTVGFVNDLWGIIVSDWIHYARELMPDTVFKLNSLNSQTLADALTASELDFGLTFEPPSAPGLHARELFQFNLALVSRETITLADAMHLHIQIDWGSAFNALYDEYFEGTDASDILFNNGEQALAYLLKHGGTAYLPLPMVQSKLDECSLFKVAGAPEFPRQVYFVYREGLVHSNHLTSLADNTISWWKERESTRTRDSRVISQAATG